MNVDEAMILVACVIAACSVVVLGWRINASSSTSNQDIRLFINIVEDLMSENSYCVILLPKPVNSTYIVLVKDGGGVSVETP